MRPAVVDLHYSKISGSAGNIARFVRLQREELVAALQFMTGKGWIQGEHPLHGMCEGLQQFVLGGQEHSLSREAVGSASLHWGSQMIKCRKGNEGARQDCYIFLSFNGRPGEPAEVCIMEIHHICKVEGTYTDSQGVQQDAKKKPALGVWRPVRSLHVLTDAMNTLMDLDSS